jgi:hypothetical protein
MKVLIAASSLVFGSIALTLLLNEVEPRDVVIAYASTEPYKVMPQDPGGLEFQYPWLLAYGVAVGRPSSPDVYLAPESEKLLEAVQRYLRFIR